MDGRNHLGEATDTVTDEPLPQSELRFSPDEEAALLDESNRQKLHANKLFASADFSEAVQQYEKALASCPNYLDYEVAVLRSNLAACHLKLEDWKSAIAAADESLQALDRLLAQEEAGEGKNDALEQADDKEEEEGEIISPGAMKLGQAAAAAPGRTHEEIARIRAKSLMRRARARGEISSWSTLTGAEEDYKTLLAMPGLPPQDRRVVTQQLRLLAPRVEAAKQKEMGEMMGKLKELGNGLLKPFGLSTDNFNMVKDESTGGYNVQFNQAKK